MNEVKIVTQFIPCAILSGAIFVFWEGHLQVWGVLDLPFGDLWSYRWFPTLHLFFSALTWPGVGLIQMVLISQVICHCHYLTLQRGCWFLCWALNRKSFHCGTWCGVSIVGSFPSLRPDPWNPNCPVPLQFALIQTFLSNQVWSLP